MHTDYISLKSLEGIIKVREWPNWIDPHSEDEWNTWWPGLTEKERDRLNAPLLVPKMKRNIFTHEDEWAGEYIEAEEAHNLITNLGITAVLKSIGQGLQAQLQVFSQIMSVGNGAITGVTRADTAVAGDGFGTNARRVPNSLAITGTQADVGTNYLSGDANGSWSNCGFYGWSYAGSSNATTTASTGQLNTHAIFSYSKGATAVTLDYVYILSN